MTSFRKSQHILRTTLALALLASVMGHAFYAETSDRGKIGADSFCQRGRSGSVVVAEPNRHTEDETEKLRLLLSDFRSTALSSSSSAARPPSYLALLSRRSTSIFAITDSGEHRQVS